VMFIITITMEIVGMFLFIQDLDLLGDILFESSEF